MKFVGEYRFVVSAEEVWRALNDTEVLRRTIPGCDKVERITPTEYAAHVSIKLGPISAAFDGKILLSDLDPPARYRISAEAHGSIAGSAAGSANVRLTDLEGGAMLRYEAETEIGGRLATIGQKFVRGTATRYADKFFARFARAMEERAAEAGAAAGIQPSLPAL
jgi:carbon monoxide dehydrogenase subunit G